MEWRYSYTSCLLYTQEYDAKQCRRVKASAIPWEKPEILCE
jgi:hypothetical protein